MPQFVIGLNPYGLAHTVGLQAFGTGRANPHGIGLDGFITLVQEAGLTCIELDWRWITPLDDEALARVRDRLAGMRVIYSHWLLQEPDESLSGAVRGGAGIGAAMIRMHLTPVLEGARASCGRWSQMIAHARQVLGRDAPLVRDSGLDLAIENHQDLGSEELLAIAGEAGAGVGLVLDTGNAYAVGEDPVAFARRVAGRVQHVHLKDYVAQFTDDGYRLVRCAVGEGAVPLAEIAAVLLADGRSLTASIEPGALEARHIRLFRPEWWAGYPPRAAHELAEMLGRLRSGCLDDRADYRTPWELGASDQVIVDYERRQVAQSLQHLRF